MPPTSNTTTVQAKDYTEAMIYECCYTSEVIGSEQIRCPFLQYVRMGDTKNGMLRLEDPVV